jgi:uncharacterized protein
MPLPAIRPSEWLFFGLALLCEVLGTVSGFGSSAYFVSLSLFFYDYTTVLALTGLLHVFSNTAKLLLFWRGIQWRLLVWLGVPSVAFVVLGAWLSAQVALRYANTLLGIFLIGMGSLLLLRPQLQLSQHRAVVVGSGAVAGFLAGLLGTGGAVRGLALAAFKLEQNAFIATSAAIDFGVDASRSVVYWQQGYMPRALWWYLPILLVLAFVGSWLGKLIVTRFSTAAFRKLVLAMLIVIGVLLLFGK